MLQAVLQAAPEVWAAYDAEMFPFTNGSEALRFPPPLRSLTAVANPHLHQMPIAEASYSSERKIGQLAHLYPVDNRYGKSLPLPTWVIGMVFQLSAAKKN